MGRLRTLTVKELKTLAKEAGVKGFSKMRKSELVEILTQVGVEFSFETIKEVVVEKTTTETIEVVEATTTVDYNTAATEVMTAINKNKNKKGEKKMNNKKQEKYSDELMNLIVRNAAPEIVEFVQKRQDKKAFKMIKQESKNVNVVASYQIVLDAIIEEDGDLPVLQGAVATNVGIESNLTRAAKMETRKFADQGMVIEMRGTTEVVSINLSDSIYKKGNKKTKDAYKMIRSRVFNMLAGKTKKFGESLNLILAPNGLARVSFTDKVELAEGEVLKTYKFAGITASGLRTRSLVGVSVKVKTQTTDINCDRRVELLNKSTNGCFANTFMAEGEFKALKDKSAQFKAAGRVTLGAPGSKEMSEVSTMICFDNLAAGAKFTKLNGEVVEAHNTADGTDTTYYGVPYASALENGVPVRKKDYIGIWDQSRGAGRKCSTDYKDRIDMCTFARHLLSNESAAEVQYVIVNGERFDSDYKTVKEGDKTKKVLVKSAWEKVVEARKDKEFFKNIEMITDENAMKMTNHDNVFRPTRLKMAYQSEMDLSMVTAMACLLADPENAPSMLMKKAVKGITAKFEDLGVKFEMEDGVIADYSLNFDGNKLNNEAQLMTYLRKSDFKKTLQLFPGAVRSDFENTVKGIAKSITEGSIALDRSFYTVVQADKAVIYGKQILAENEIFCNTIEADRVAITRHPISALHAVTILNAVSIEEMVERILALDLNTYQKRHLINYMVSAREVCIIPASHYLMEKHDGMDFDIDAVQIIEDKEIVDCLAKLENRGSVIRDTEIANAARHIETKMETAIAEFKKKPGVGLFRPAEDKDTMTQEVKKAKKSSHIKADITKKKKAETEEKIDLSFVNTTAMIQNYFDNPIASVGQIANAFYNNALILLTLKSDEASVELKEEIAKAFRVYYNCEGKKQYVSTIDRTTASYEVDKFDCTEAVFRFAECDGSIHSLIAYLEDCCDYNRYLAETSIDSAKNNYFIINMFRHSSIIATLGAKADCEAELVTIDGTFAEMAAAYDLSEKNYFQMKLISLEMQKGMPIEAYQECGGMVEVERGGQIELEQATLAIPDPLYAIKEEMVELTNSLIVLVAKLMEDVVNSQEARDFRDEVRMASSLILEGNTPEELIANLSEEDKKKLVAHVHNGTAPAIDAIKKTYSTLTMALSKNNDSDSDEVEGVSKVEFLKTVATNGIRNAMNHAFSDLTDIELGAIVCNNLISEVSDEKCGTINPALYKTCEGQIIEFLSEMGFENVGFIGEEISYAEANKRAVKLSNFVGTNVMVADGTAELENGTTFVMKNRRANLNGTIVAIGNKFYVQAVKDVDNADAEAGLFLNVIRNSKLNKIYADLTNVDVMSYEFKTVYTHKASSTKLWNVIIAKDVQDNEYVVASVTAREGLTEVLKNINLENMNSFSYTNSHGFVNSVIYIPGADYMAATQNTESEEFGDFDFSDFSAPEGLEFPQVEGANENLEPEMDFGFGDFAEPTFA